MERLFVLYAIASKFACLYIPATPTLPEMGRGTCFSHLIMLCTCIVSHCVVVDESGTTSSQLGVAKLSISQSSRAFHPVILLITTCLDMSYITIHNTLIPYVCARLYVIEDLCSLPFCAIVRVSCVVSVATRQLRYN